MIGTDGRVAVWEYAREKWIRSWPVDAKEIVNTGAGSLTGPADEKPPEDPKPEAKPKPKPHPIGEPDPKVESAQVKASFPQSDKAAKAAGKPKKSGGKG
jgi:hypothetical protein